MSGLFSRITRRRAEPPAAPDPDETTAATGAGPEPDPPASDGDQPTLVVRRAEPAASAAETTAMPSTETPTDGSPAEAAGAEAPAADGTPAEAAAPEPPTDAPAPEPAAPLPADVAPDATAGGGFRDRSRMRRRLRYLRRARELQLRDLGGLVFDLHRFGEGADEAAQERRGALVSAKVAALDASDREVRALEQALGDRRPVRELHEAGIGGTCARCGALYGSDARFCSACGTPVGAPAEAATAPTEATAPETPPAPLAEPSAPEPPAPAEATDSPR